MNPEIEINIDLNSGEVEKWGLYRDDSCVVVVRMIDGKWEHYRNSYIPSAVALHISAVASADIAIHAGFDAAIHVVHGKKDVVGECPAGESVQ